MKKTTSSKAVQAAREMIEMEDHEHDHDCYELKTIYIDYWPSPDVDGSYEQEIYVCRITGEEIPSWTADPERERADARQAMDEEPKRYDDD